MELYGYLIEIAKVLATLLVAGIAFWQLQTLIRQVRSQYEWSRHQNALSYSLTKDFRFRQTRVRLDQQFGIVADKKEPIPLEIIKLAIEEDPEIYTYMVDILKHWENMALSIYSGTANEEVAFEMVSGIVVSYVLAFRSFIDDSRDDGRVGRRPYAYLMRLVRRWEERMERESLEFPDPPSTY